jgi:hypothetical protein
VNNLFLTSNITALTTGVVQTLSNPNKHTIKEYKETLRNPHLRACIRMKGQRAANSIGEYQFKNKEIEKWVKNNINNVHGNLRELVGVLASGASAFGHMAVETAKERKYGNKFRKIEWHLGGFNVLDPERVHYAGNYGAINYVKYQDAVRELYIPYEKCLHITNSGTLDFNTGSVYGDPDCEVAYPYVKLYNIIMSEMAISAKTLATGIIVGLADADNTVYLYDNNGDPLRDSNNNLIKRNAVQHLADQLKQLENRSHIVTDKKNSIVPLQIPAGEQFWTISENMLKRNIFASCGVPVMVFDEGSSAIATATLSVKQETTLDTTIADIVAQIKDQLIEKVIRPLIVANFGKQSDYGDFVVQASADPAQDSLITSNLMTAFSLGLLQSSDIDAVNALRERLKLPPVTPEQQQQQAQMTAMLQQLQQPVAPEVDPNSQPQEQQDESYDQQYLAA